MTRAREACSVTVPPLVSQEGGTASTEQFAPPLRHLRALRADKVPAAEARDPGERRTAIASSLSMNRRMRQPHFAGNFGPVAQERAEIRQWARSGAVNHRKLR